MERVWLGNVAKGIFVKSRNFRGEYINLISAISLLLLSVLRSFIPFQLQNLTLEQLRIWCLKMLPQNMEEIG